MLTTWEQVTTLGGAQLLVGVSARVEGVSDGVRRRPLCTPGILACCRERLPPLKEGDFAACDGARDGVREGGLDGGR